MFPIYKALKNLKVDTEDGIGYVYILKNPDSGLIKCGTTTNPKERFSALKNQNGSKLEYTLVSTYIPYILEKVMHGLLKFDGNRMCRREGEWFDRDYEDAIHILEDVMKSADYKRRNFRRC